MGYSRWPLSSLLLTLPGWSNLPSIPLTTSRQTMRLVFLVLRGGEEDQGLKELGSSCLEQEDRDLFTLATWLVTLDSASNMLWRLTEVSGSQPRKTGIWKQRLFSTQTMLTRLCLMIVSMLS